MTSRLSENEAFLQAFGFEAEDFIASGEDVGQQRDTWNTLIQYNQDISDWTVEEISSLRDNVPKLALNAPHRDGTVRDIARDMLAIARKGLVQRKYPGHKTGRDEAHYLDQLDSIVTSGKTFAEDLLKDYEEEWSGSILPIYEACKY